MNTLQSKPTNSSKAMPATNRLPKSATAYVALIAISGFAVAAWGLVETLSTADWTLGLLAALTAGASCFAIRFGLPGGKAGGFGITLAECFSFTGILVFGPLGAACLAIIDGIVGNLRFGVKSLNKIVFNIAQITLSIFLMGHLFQLLNGGPAAAGADLLNGRTFVALGLSALIYFVVSSSLVAVAMSLASGRAFSEIWKRHFPWATPTTLLAAAAAVCFVLGMDQTTGMATVLIAVSLTLVTISGAYTVKNKRLLVQRLGQSSA